MNLNANDTQLLGQTCAILTALVWSFAMVLFKLSGQRVAPLALNLFKNAVGLSLLALTILVMWLAKCGPGLVVLREQSTRDVWLLLISGFIGIAVADTIFFRGLNLIGVGIVAIVDCLYSPSVIFFAYLMLGERLAPWQVAGGAVIVGAVFVSTHVQPPKDRTHRQLALGIVLAACSMALMAFGIVLVKPLLGHFPLIWAATLRMVAGTLSLAVIAAISPQRQEVYSTFRPQQVWRWSVPAAVLGAYVSMILWVAGFKYMPASAASILNQTSTVFALILATLLLKEGFDRRKAVALVLAVVGVTLVTLGGAR
jgi:drug/metabolite transporter (DMT)-like permease